MRFLVISWILFFDFSFLELIVQIIVLLSFFDIAAIKGGVFSSLLNEYKYKREQTLIFKVEII